MHWPADGCSLGVGGVSYVELLILSEIWAGERLQLEKAVHGYRRPGRSISVSAVPFGPGTDICLPVGLLVHCFGVFGICLLVFDDLFLVILVLITVGCGILGHGLTSRPRESASEDFLHRLLLLFGYPSWSAAALLAGVLPLRYCSARLACRFPKWKLPDKGHVCELVTDSVVDDRVLGGDVVCRVSFPSSAW